MSREISPQVRTSALHVTECVRSIFVLELLDPGPYLYLCSENLRNTPVLLNRLGEFGQLFPEIDTQELRLDGLLAILAGRGVKVRLIHTLTDIEELLPAIAGSGIYRRGRTPLFPQGLLSTKLGLCGKLHFGDDVIDGRGEAIDLITEPLEVERMALQLESYWEELA